MLTDKQKNFILNRLYDAAGNQSEQTVTGILWVLRNKVERGVKVPEAEANYPKNKLMETFKFLMDDVFSDRILDPTKGALYCAHKFSLPDEWDDLVEQGEGKVVQIGEYLFAGDKDLIEPKEEEPEEKSIEPEPQEEQKQVVQPKRVSPQVSRPRKVRFVKPKS